MAILLQSENHVTYQKELATDPKYSKFLNEILQSFRTEEKSQDTRRDRIRELAKRMEEIKLQFGLVNEINKICTEICQTFRRAKVPEWQIRDIYRAFEKEGYEIFTERVVYGRSLAITGNLPEENTILMNRVKEAFHLLLEEDWHHFTKSQIQDIFDNFDKGTSKYSTICQENGIATITSGNSSHQFYQMSTNNEKYPQKIETPEPGYEWTVLSAEWEALSVDCHLIAVQCANFPPQIKAQAIKIAQGVKAFRQFLMPGMDRKHKRHWGDWIENVQTTIDASINGTATLHPTESNLCDKCVQPDLDQDPHGTWKLKKPIAMKSIELNTEGMIVQGSANLFKRRFMADHNLDFENKDHQDRMSKIIEDGYYWECPKCHGVFGRTIIVSREHTSDMIKPTLNLVKDLINHFPPFISFCKWYAEWRRPILDSQTINLSPKLKERKSG